MCVAACGGDCRGHECHCALRSLFKTTRLFLNTLESLFYKKKILKQKQKIYAAIREWFYKKDFLEIQTPIVLAHPTLEPNITPFETSFYNDQKKIYKGFLRVSPEFSLKKALASGLDKVYEIASCFRSEEPLESRWHNAEFTMLEWYRLNAGYEDILKDTKELLWFICKKMFGATQFVYEKNTIDLNKWEIHTIEEVFLKHADIDFRKIKNFDELLLIAKKKGYKNLKDKTQAFYNLFLEEIEPHLCSDCPTVLMDYPHFLSGFSKLKDNNKKYCERFEIYFGQIEIANAYSELTDKNEQEQRMLVEQKKLSKNKKHHTLDPHFLDAVEKIPKAAGIALGLDRLVMLLTNTPKISDTIFLNTNNLFDKK